MSKSLACLCAYYDDDVLFVGRNDGLVCWLQLGLDYLTTFTNQLVAGERNKRHDDGWCGIEMDYCNNNELLSKMGSSLSSSDHQFEILTRSWKDRWPRSNNWHCAKLDKVRVDDSISLPITS